MSRLDLSIGIYPTAPVAEVIRLARLAEDLGFQAAWIGDSQCLWREAHVTLGALGASTSRIRLGTSVTNPRTRHVTVTASAAYTLAELAGAVAAIRALCGGQAVPVDGVAARLSGRASPWPCSRQNPSISTRRTGGPSTASGRLMITGSTSVSRRPTPISSPIAWWTSSPWPAGPSNASSVSRPSPRAGSRS